MAMNSKQLKELVIEPVLQQLGHYGDSAVNLLLLTAAVESDMGSYLKQVNGPALGIYQMEPSTNDDIWTNFLGYRDILRANVVDTTVSNQPEELIGNLNYATAMARVHYLRVPEPLPEAEDVHGLAMYWKKYWNTDLGMGTVDSAIAKYTQYCLGGVPWQI